MRRFFAKKKKRKEKRNLAKQNPYFQSTHYNLTLFDCVPITVLSQTCSRMKSPWIWIHSGVISVARRTQRPQLNPRLNWSQHYKNHILNYFLIVILQQFTFAHTEHILILCFKKEKNFHSITAAFSSYAAQTIQHMRWILISRNYHVSVCRGKKSVWYES